MIRKRDTNPHLVTDILRRLVAECKAAGVEHLPIAVVEEKLHALEAERDAAIRRSLS